MNITTWTEEELQYIKDNYQDKSYAEIGDALGRTLGSIRTKIHRLGLKKSVYHCDYDYFKTIDTEDKAYWLGFIYADGNVNKALSTLTINLQARDSQHLSKFNKSICGNFPIKIYDERHGDKTYPMCRLLVYSTKMMKDLVEAGITPNKTKTMKMPNIPSVLMRHFIRGYFDGDGCVCEHKHKRGLSVIGCSFVCGNSVFLEDMRKILYDNDIKSYLQPVYNHPENMRLTMAGLLQPDNFLHYIYDDATIYLDRKYKKKNELYEELHIEQRLLRQTEKSGSFNLSEKENGNPEMEIRVEGYA